VPRIALPKGSQIVHNDLDSLRETVYNFYRNILVFLGRHSTNMYLVHMVFLLYYKPFVFENRHFMVSWCLLMILSLGTSIILEAVKKMIGWNRVITSVFQHIAASLQAKKDN
jgi:hypothetical protein